MAGSSQGQELLTGRVRLALCPYMLDRGGDVRNAGLQHIEAAIQSAEGAHDTGDRFAREVAGIGRLQPVELECDHAGRLNPMAIVAFAVGPGARCGDGH